MRGAHTSKWAYGAGVLLVAAMGCWTMALVEATKSGDAVVLVYGPHPAIADRPVPIRVVLFDAKKRTRVDASASIQIDDDVTETGFDSGEGALSLPSAGASILHVTAKANGTSTSVDVPLLVGGEHRTHQLVAKPWFDETTRGPSAVFPEHGRVSSFANTNLVVVDNGASVVAHPPNVLAAKTPDGRELALRRADFQLTLSPKVNPGPLTVVVESSRPQSLAFDVFLDGQLAHFQTLAVDAGKHSYRLNTVAGKRGQVWTVSAASSPLARRGAIFGSTVIASTLSEAALRLLQVHEGTGANAEPATAIVEAAKTVAASDARVMLRALASRIEVAPRSLTAIGPSASVQREQRKAKRLDEVRRWRRWFRWIAIVFGGVIVGLALVPAFRTRRQQHRVGREIDDETADVSEVDAAGDGEAPLQSTAASIRSIATAGSALLVALLLLWVLDWVLSFVVQP